MRLGFLAALSAAAICAHGAQPTRPQPLKGGIEFQSADVRALQSDDFANPMALWVTRGEALWSQPRGEGGKSCASCHGEAKRSMRGVAASYPRYDDGTQRVLNLEQRILACNDTRLKAPAIAYESEDLIGLTAYVALQSRGEPLAVSIDGPAHATWEAGRDLYFKRIGQMNLACTQCHDRSWGKTLLAESISQGHPTGWPAYRIQWQRPGSLDRRLRACYNGVRAQMPAYGAPEMVALELYLAWRAQGLALEAPGVRR
jgi:L-cysteine S-thiosulfotransferase